MVRAAHSVDVRAPRGGADGDSARGSPTRVLAFALCGLASLTLNAIPLWIASAAPQSRAATPTLRVVELRGLTSRSTSPVVERAVGLGVEVDRRTIAMPLARSSGSPKPEPGPESRPSAPVVTPPVVVVAAAESPVEPHYFRYDEVDSAAVPDLDWNLDTALLDTAGIDRLAFEIFIDAQGAVVDVRLLEPAIVDAEVSERLLERLRSTLLSPARRFDRAVASVRRIEVKLSSG